MNFRHTGGHSYSDEEIEKGIREEPTIFFKVFIYNGETVRQLIDIFFQKSWSHNSYNSNDPNNKQCDGGRSRSFTDLYSFILHHIPETDIKELKYYLKEMFTTGKLVSEFCDDIERTILHYPGQNISTNHNYLYNSFSQNKTEFNMTMDEFLNN